MDARACQDASNLESWRRRFGYISVKATLLLLDVATGIEITDLKAPHHPRGEPMPLTQTHELAVPRRQISRRPQDDPSQSIGCKLRVDIIHETVHGFMEIHALVSGLEMHHVEIVFNKNEICPFVQGLVVMYERQSNMKIKVVQIDGEASLADNFNEWIRTTGINLCTSAPDSWDQNGPIERAGGRLGEKLCVYPHYSPRAFSRNYGRLLPTC
jgi:hypothetical protein